MKTELKREYERLYLRLDMMEAFAPRPVRNRGINQLLKRLEELRAQIARQ
jgi:hypothetical protein